MDFKKTRYIATVEDCSPQGVTDLTDCNAYMLLSSMTKTSWPDLPEEYNFYLDVPASSAAYEKMMFKFSKVKWAFEQSQHDVDLDFTIFYNGLPEGWEPPSESESEEEVVEEVVEVIPEPVVEEPEITIQYASLEKDEWTRGEKVESDEPPPPPPPLGEFGCLLLPEPKPEECKEEDKDLVFTPIVVEKKEPLVLMEEEALE